MRLKNKVSLITGAGSGMGRAASILFAKEGARVVVSDVNAAAGSETVEMAKSEGGEAVFVKADVANAAECEGAVAQAIAKYGKLDVLYNNAGIEGAMSEIKDYPEEAFDKVISVNLKGVFLMTQAAIPEIVKAGGGSIINTASTFAYVGAALFGPYCATKGAVLLLTKTLALELASFKIRVNCVCPAAIVTDMHTRYLGEILGIEVTEKQKERVKQLIFEASKPGELFVGSEAEKAHLAKHPIGRFGAPVDVARAALFLASDESSYTTGSSLFVDGGYTAV